WRSPSSRPPCGGDDALRAPLRAPEERRRDGVADVASPADCIELDDGVPFGSCMFDSACINNLQG
ncbi:hypothetical protein, partial [Corallococcus sp. 4LFB]|uniref:hypothetical protein n=1 Tax=Corallococcus sp. 4LFB TaxID=3383249 RepID=UPI003975D9A2